MIKYAHINMTCNEYNIDFASSNNKVPSLASIYLKIHNKKNKIQHYGWKKVKTITTVTKHFNQSNKIQKHSNQIIGLA